MIRRSADNILAQLGLKKKLDMFGLGCREYVDTGKIGGIALSECSAATIYEAARHVKVAAVEVELSMFSWDILTNGVAVACAEHGIPIAAYSPIGRGSDALAHNLQLVDKIHALAASKGCMLAQLAIAWVRSISSRPGMPTVIPIPGSTTVSRVRENSTVVELSNAELEEIGNVLEGFETAGARYPQGIPTEL
ncbi:hypothetical protein ACO1O0_001168 [Amphichorda felina]